MALNLETYKHEIVIHSVWLNPQESGAKIHAIKNLRTAYEHLGLDRLGLREAKETVEAGIGYVDHIIEIDPIHATDTLHRSQARVEMVTAWLRNKGFDVSAFTTKKVREALDV